MDFGHHAPLVRLTHLVLPLFYSQVQTPERADWLECPEGAELMTLLQDMSTSNRCDSCCLNHDFMTDYSFISYILIEQILRIDHTFKIMFALHTV